MDSSGLRPGSNLRDESNIDITEIRAVFCKPNDIWRKEKVFCSQLRICSGYSVWGISNITKAFSIKVSGLLTGSSYTYICRLQKFVLSARLYKKEFKISYFYGSLGKTSGLI
jgi:hypothetical protein